MAKSEQGSERNWQLWDGVFILSPSGVLILAPRIQGSPILSPRVEFEVLLSSQSKAPVQQVQIGTFHHFPPSKTIIIILFYMKFKVIIETNYIGGWTCLDWTAGSLISYSVVFFNLIIKKVQLEGVFVIVHYVIQWLKRWKVNYPPRIRGTSLLGDRLLWSRHACQTFRCITCHSVKWLNPWKRNWTGLGGTFCARGKVREEKSIL